MPLFIRTSLKVTLVYGQPIWPYTLLAMACLDVEREFCGLHSGFTGFLLQGLGQGGKDQIPLILPPSDLCGLRSTIGG